MLLPIVSPAAPADERVWLNLPASHCTESCPLGNGRLARSRRSICLGQGGPTEGLSISCEGRPADDLVRKDGTFSFETEAGNTYVFSGEFSRR